MNSIPSASPPPLPAALTDRQLELYEALVDFDGRIDAKPPKLALMYLGAILVRGQTGNPDVVALAAHGLRELMEKLARHLDVPMVQMDLTGRVRQLAEKYRAIEDSDPQHREKRRTEFQDSAVALAAWFPTQHTTRANWAGEVMVRLDPRGLQLPTPAKQPHVKTWNDCHKCFQDAAHHRAITATEFGRHVQLFEDFLLDRLRPRTVGDQRLIEDIVREGEGDA